LQSRRFPSGHGLVLNAGDATIKEGDLNVEKFQKKTLHDIFTWRSAITAKP
jgi:hypothetical protein